MGSLRRFLITSRRGQGMMQTITILGTATVLLVGALEAINATSKSQSAAQIRTDFENRSRTIETILSRPETCTQQLKSLTFNETIGTATNISIYADAAKSILLARSTPAMPLNSVPGYQITNFTLIPQSSLQSNSVFNVKIILEGSRLQRGQDSYNSETNYVGNYRMHKEYSVIVNAVDNAGTATITDCYTGAMTPTPTPTASATPTNTPTATATPTPPATATPTPDVTSTPSPTPTPATTTSTTSTSTSTSTTSTTSTSTSTSTTSTTSTSTTLPCVVSWNGSSWVSAINQKIDSIYCTNSPPGTPDASPPRIGACCVTNNGTSEVQWCTENNLAIGNGGPWMSAAGTGCPN